MTEPEIEDGYPTEATLQAIRDWPLGDVNGLLDFIQAAWLGTGFATHDLSAHEGYVVHAEPDQKFLRLATGGWSGNESLISAFRSNLNHRLAWRLSAVGGLHIYRYMELVQPREDGTR